MNFKWVCLQNQVVLTSKAPERKMGGLYIHFRIKDNESWAKYISFLKLIRWKTRESLCFDTQKNETFLWCQIFGII